MCIGCISFEIIIFLLYLQNNDEKPTAGIEKTLIAVYLAERVLRCQCMQIFLLKVLT